MPGPRGGAGLCGKLSAQALTLADDETLITRRSSGDCARHAGGAAVAARYAALQPAQCWREGQANGDDAPRGSRISWRRRCVRATLRRSISRSPAAGAAAGRPLSHVWGSTVFANGPARCITISRSGSSWLKRGISPPRSRFPIRPTACRRSPAASVPRTGCVKAPAPCAMKAGSHHRQY